MASPPPPYANVTGISRAVMKDSPQETFASYNGNARPGELVVNLDVNPPTLYIGNSLGNLNQVTGNGGGNASLPLSNGNSQFDIAAANGNVTITANGSYTWIFDQGGNLTAPGAINVGNMVIGTVPGDITADANTGVTFNVSGPDGGFAVNYLDEVGNANTSGGELAFNSELGNATYRISLSDDLGDGFATKIWRFDGTGNLSLPGGGSLYGLPSTPSGLPGNTIVLQPVGPGYTTNQKLMVYPTAGDGDHIHMTTGNLYETELFLGSDDFFVKLSNTGNVVVNTDDTLGNTATWTFTTDGNLVLANGNSIIQSIANSSLDPTNPNVSTMTLTPDANYSGQALVLDPTAPGHIHLRSPAYGSNIDDPVANLFLGGEQTAFEVTQGANSVARIHSGNLTWTFSNSSGASVIDLPGESYIRSNQDTVNIQSVDANNIGRGIYIGTNGTLYFWDGNSQSVSIQQDNTNANITAIGNASITSNVHTWTFGDDGTLLLPRDAVGNTDPYLWITGGNAPSISSVDVSLAGPANFQIVSDYLNLSGYTGAKVAIKADNGEIATDANMVLSTNNANVASIYSWTFGTDGTLTVPGDLIANGASPAPSLSGFSSITSLVSITTPQPLASLTATAGGRAFASDANLVAAGNFGANVSNGGSNTVPVWSDGTNWYIG